MEKTFEASYFQELNSIQMQVIDGGADLGQVAALTGGTVAFAWGVIITMAGVCTFNGGIALAGLGLTYTGFDTISSNW